MAIGTIKSVPEVDHVISIGLLNSAFQHSMQGKAAGIARVVQEGQEENLGFSIGGASAGALIGTFIAPGLGTAIGGAIGWVAGKLFGPSLEDLKQKSFEKISESLNATFDDAAKSVGAAADQQTEEARRGMELVIDHYVARYDALVKEMIARDEAQRVALEQNRRMIQQDLRLLGQRQSQINQWQGSLRAIHIAG